MSFSSQLTDVYVSFFELTGWNWIESTKFGLDVAAEAGGLVRWSRRDAALVVASCGDVIATLLRRQVSLASITS